MVPDQNMSLKLDIPPTILKNGPMKVSDEVKDYVFGNTASCCPQEKEMVACGGSCQENINTMDMEISPGGHDHGLGSRGCDGVEEVDIVGGWNPSDEAVVGRNSQDVTETSSLSSFGSTGSGAENAALSNDVEVDSLMGEVNESVFEFNGFDGLFRMRKQRLTPKWREFIHPWMRRCKWVELRIREIESRASKYERELAECYRRKQSEWEKYASEDRGIKSVPFSFHNHPIKLMKWRRRKRVEETVDLASYTKSHELFSYFEKRRCVGGFVRLDEDDDLGKVEKAPIDDDFFGVKGGLSTLDFMHSDAFESILRKIEEAQSQVRQLRVRIDKLVTENAGKFTAEDPSILPHNQLASFVPNLVTSNVDNESLHAISQQIADEKLLVLENVVYSNGEGTLLPNLVENTGHPLICEYTENVSTSYAAAVRQELNNNNSEEVRAECIAESSRSKTGNTESRKTTTNSKSGGGSGQKNKRKRGSRKAGTGKWNRKSSG